MKKIKVRKSFYIMAIIPFVWTAYLHYMVATESSLGWFFPPSYIGYFMFGIINFKSLNQQFHFYENELILIKGFRKHVIAHDDLIRIDEIRWNRGQLLRVFYHKDGRTRKVKFRPYNFTSNDQDEIERRLNQILKCK